MEIPYDYYRIFYYVAKYKNITQASAALTSSQPNVTRAVKNLESFLGCSLFVRSNRGVTLTPEGQKLYAHVSIAFEHIENAEMELTLDKRMLKGVVSIGATEIALHSILLPVLKRYRNQYPDIKIRVSNHSTAQALHALRERLVDFAVVSSPMELPKGMEQTMLKQIQEVAVCGSAYSGLSGRTLSLAELTQYPMICLGQQTQTYQMYANWFTQNDLVLAPDIEAATADQILPLVRNDLGIGFVPEEFLASEGAAAGIFRLNLEQPVPRRSVCIVKRSDTPLSIAATELEKLLLQCRQLS